MKKKKVRGKEDREERTKEGTKVYKYPFWGKIFWLFHILKRSVTQTVKKQEQLVFHYKGCLSLSAPLFCSQATLPLITYHNWYHGVPENYNDALSFEKCLLIFYSFRECLLPAQLTVAILYLSIWPHLRCHDIYLYFVYLIKQSDIKTYKILGGKTKYDFRSSLSLLQGNKIFASV